MLHRRVDELGEELDAAERIHGRFPGLVVARPAGAPRRRARGAAIIGPAFRSAIVPFPGVERDGWQWNRQC